MKKGESLSWTTIIVGLIMLVVTLFILRAAIVGENAWLPRAGIISNQTANSLETLFGPGLRLSQADVLQESNLTAPPKFKVLYDTFKNNIESYQKSPDLGCYITFDHDQPLEEKYSFSLRRSGQDIDLILTKSRTLIIENDKIDNLNLCSIAAKNIQYKKTPEVFQLQRFDIEPFGKTSFVFFDGKLNEEKKFFIDNLQNKVILYKESDENICFVPFQVSGLSVPLLGWALGGLTQTRSSDVGFFIEKSNADEFYKEGGLFYKPKCRLILPKYQYITEKTTPDGTKLTITTTIYSRKDMKNEKKQEYEKLLSTFYTEYFKTNSVSQAIKTNPLDLKKQIKTSIKSKITAPAINYDVTVKLEKSGKVISLV